MLGGFNPFLDGWWARRRSNACRIADHGGVSILFLMDGGPEGLRLHLSYIQRVGFNPFLDGWWARR